MSDTSSQPALRALALNCTLKADGESSSTAKLLEEVLTALREHGAEGDQVRIAELDVRPGVETDMGDGDQWPAIRTKLLASDIVVLGTPVWMGHPSSVAQRVIERLDAELAETDERGRPELFDKVAAVAVVGNEDGAHKIIADMFQALNDVGFTIPAQAGTYWVGEAMQSVDYKDLPRTPDAVGQATATLARNATHLARLLRERPYPPAEG
ncbi:flavodoxin family protein [Microbacterium sp. NPDC058389]|uniref:flavodoxin family protein n=1 Tax=Microbacterium sp. NPDC058389 TaxID=3346475 RepID=UPI003662EA28